MKHIFIISFILGVLVIKDAKCQEFMFQTLNAPATLPFMHYPDEHLMMDMSERHPVFMYASSQNDFIHERLPEHHAVPPNLSRPHQRQRQNNAPKTKFINSPSPIHRENKPRNTPQLTYGFQPKPSRNRPINNQVQKKNLQSPQNNRQNEGFRARPPQNAIHQPSTRYETQQTHDQRQQFTEHIPSQSTFHQKQQNDHTTSSNNHQNGFGHSSQPFNYQSQILAPEGQYIFPSRPNKVNPVHQNAGEENRRPIANNQRANKPNKENGQESVRKQPTFAGAAQAFKSRLNNNNQATNGAFPPKVFNENYNRQNIPERNQNNNERLVMQDYARSMRENMPQLPPRPPFNNGGVKINTLAGELPVLHLDSINTLRENPALYLQTNNRHEYVPTDEQEKKTYLLIKAPSAVTTEIPPLEKIRKTNEKHTSSPPYMINDYRETSPNLPDIAHSTISEPRVIPDTAQTPAIVLDLVQIPDHAIFNPAEHNLVPIQHSEFRSVDNKYENHENSASAKKFQQPEFKEVDNKYKNEESFHVTKNYRQPQFIQSDNRYINEKNFRTTKSYQQPDFQSVANSYDNEESFHPTESYPTTPMQAYKDVTPTKKKSYTSVPEYDNDAYYSHPKDRTYSTLSLENSLKYQNKFTPKPKIKELLKSSNFSSLPPISYSSSVSVVSVKQNVEAKPSSPKKQKTTLKKAVASKRKAIIPENQHVSYDDYDDGEGVPGDPGIDYPTYKDIPVTKFECKNEQSPGFYADIETGCQVFHNCDTGMTKHSFMCPNGTIFNQELFICDWWYNVKCENSPEFYSLNSGLFITGNTHEESQRI